MIAELSDDTLMGGGIRRYGCVGTYSAERVLSVMSFLPLDNPKKIGHMLQMEKLRLPEGNRLATQKHTARLGSSQVHQLL